VNKASKPLKENKLHGRHIKNKLEELQEKIKITNSNISLFITVKEGTKQASPHRATSTQLSYKQPAHNQATPPPPLYPKLCMKKSCHCFLLYSTKAALNDLRKRRHVTNLPVL